MGTSTNPFRTSVELKAAEMAIHIKILKKEDNSVVEEEVFQASGVADNLRGDVALYGLSKLLQDRTSEVEVGPGKIAAMRALMEQFGKGVWSQDRKPGAPVVSAEVEALAQIKGCTVAEAQSALRKYPADVKANILANPQIVELATKIRESRKAAESISLDDLATPAAA